MTSMRIEGAFGAPVWAEKHRVSLPGYPRGDRQNGAFLFVDKGLKVIISAGAGWEHVSVSRKSRVPTYDDMAWIAQTFWRRDQTVMQLHVPAADHINVAEHCLHLWRPIDQDIPRPPGWMVG